MKGKKALVLGAGLAGLSAAHRLLEKGFEVEVVEANSFVGGLAATIKEGPYYMDFGPHPFYTEKEDIQELFKELIADDLLSFERRCLLYFNDRFVNYPLNIRTALFEMGLTTSIVSGLSFAKASTKKFFRKPEIKNFEDWARAGFGNHLYKIFFKPYTEKFWGVKCSELDAFWANQRVAKVNLIKTLKSIFSKPKKGEIASQIERSNLLLFYPRKGIGTLAERIAERVQKRGGKIYLNSKVSKVKKTKNGFSVECVSGGKTKTFAASYLFSSLPVPLFAKMLFPKPPKDILLSASKLRYRSLVLLYIASTKQDIMQVPYIYFMNRSFHRLTETNKWSQELSPADENMLSVEFSCFEGDATWNKSKEQLFEQAIAELEKDGFLKKSEVTNYFLLKAPHVYPVYLTDYREHFSKVMNHLKKIDNIYFIGRTGQFNYLDMDQVMKQSFIAVDQLAANAIR